MSDTIDRQSAIEAISEYGSIWMEYTDNMSIHEVSERALKASKQSMIRILKDLPAGQERKNGKWIYLKGLFTFECSVCGGQMVRSVFHYCPWCGAEMRGGDADA